MADYDDFDFDTFVMADSGMDSFLADTSSLKTATKLASGSHTIRISSVKDLEGFRRVAHDTLVRKSENDLWELKQSGDGEWLIERLCDDNGDPLKVV